jgi:hypothetical protein
MLRFSIAQAMIFGIIGGAMENLIIPLTIARQFVLGTSIETLGTVS